MPLFRTSKHKGKVLGFAECSGHLTSRLASLRHRSFSTSNFERSWSFVDRQRSCTLDIVNEASEEENEGFIRSLGNLQDGEVFADKYIIQKGAVHNKPHIVYAKNKYNKDRVALKFYASLTAFEECKEKYARLRKSDFVCRMVEAIEKQGYPPCLVFPRGEITLEEWMLMENIDLLQRKWALLHILKGLIHLHKSGFVHCDLKPSNIMLFYHTNWMLLDLDSSKMIGEAVSSVRTTPRYAAPEITQGQVLVMPSADMWSFGIIAFELLTGNPFYNKAFDLERVSHFQECRWYVENIIESMKEGKTRALIETLLLYEPSKRAAANAIAKHDIFKAAYTTTLPMLSEPGKETVVREISVDLTQVENSQMKKATLTLRLRAEVLREQSDLRQGSSAASSELRRSSSRTEDDPVFELGAYETCRLRVTLTHDNVACLRVRGVVGIAVLLDRTSFNLTIEKTAVDDRECEVVALLDLRSERFEKLCTPGFFELVLDKIVRLKLTFCVGLNSDIGHDWEIDSILPFKITPDKMKCGVYRAAQWGLETAQRGLETAQSLSMDGVVPYFDISWPDSEL